MSTPDATGSGRPLHTAGLALLAIAGISLLIALLTWLGGDDEGGSSAVGTPPAPTTSATSAAPTTAESAAPAPGGAVAPGGAGQPGAGQPGAGQPGGAGLPGPGKAGDADGARQPYGGAATPPGGEARPAPGGGAGGARQVDGREDGVERPALRVYNNSFISGLAARAAEDFREAGWPVVEVGNYSSGTIPTSTVYYQRGTDQRSAAEVLGRQFGLRVEPRFPGIRDATPGLIVIVTKDYDGR